MQQSKIPASNIDRWMKKKKGNILCMRRYFKTGGAVLL